MGSGVLNHSNAISCVLKNDSTFTRIHRDLIDRVSYADDALVLISNPTNLTRPPYPWDLHVRHSCSIHPSFIRSTSHRTADIWRLGLETVACVCSTPKQGLLLSASTVTLPLFLRFASVTRNSQYHTTRHRHCGIALHQVWRRKLGQDGDQRCNLKRTLVFAAYKIWR